jgi:hypothetical protein
LGKTFDPAEMLMLPLMANLATIGADGPRNSPVWFLWDGDALWMLGHKDASSVKRLIADPRCAVEIVHYDNADGVLGHLGFRGSATIEAMNPELFRRLPVKYLGPDEASWNPWFIENVAMIDDPEGRLIRLVAVSTFTNNVSYFRTGPELAWP